jgi:hypothetical protein
LPGIARRAALKTGPKHLVPLTIVGWQPLSALYFAKSLKEGLDVHQRYGIS